MRSIVMLLVFLILPLSLWGQSTSMPSRIAVVVNKDIITEGGLSDRLHLAAVNANIDPTPANLEKLKSQMLHAMINEVLQRQIAEQYKIQVTDKEMQESIALLEKNSGMEPGHIARIMKENKIPLSTLEDQIRTNRMWVELIRAKYASTIQISDSEIAQALQLEKEKEGKTQYHLAEIVLHFDGHEQEVRVKNDLNRLMEELQKGAHFSVLAQQFSQAPTAALGGDMGWMTEEELSPEVAEFLAHMEPGQLSKPIRTPHSYILIGYIEKKLPSTSGQTLLKMQQILFPFPPKATESEMLPILQQAEKVSHAAKSCATLESLARKEMSSIQTNSQEGIFETMPSALQKVLQDLPANKATAPLLTEQGALLVMICSKEKKKIEPLTEEAVRNNLLERKLQRFADRELRDFKKSAYIDFRGAVPSETKN